MKKTYIDQTAFRYKLAYDGIDLISKPLGDSVIGSYGKNYIKKHCRLEFSRRQAEFFIQTCIEERKHSKDIDFRGLSQDLCDKYEVGLLTVSKQNCIAGVEYVLFNEEQLIFWDKAGVGIFDVQFMVVPSRGWDGQINEIGFRVLNTKQVHDGFKWLFPIGQQATFGLHKCNPNARLVFCEGFLDYVAFSESEYRNIVGLGSVEITSNHLRQIGKCDFAICLDMDRYGFLKASEFIDQSRACFYSPEGKDPYEVYQKHGKVHLVNID